MTRLRTVWLGEALDCQAPKHGHAAGKDFSPAFSTWTLGSLSAAGVCACTMEPGSSSLKPLGGHPGSLKTEKPNEPSPKNGHYQTEVVPRCRTARKGLNNGDLQTKTQRPENG